MAKLCPRGKAAAKRKFKVYPSAYANMYASAVCSGKVTPGGKKNRKKKAFGGTSQDDKRDVRKVEHMVGESRSSKREKGRKKAMGGGMMMSQPRAMYKSGGRGCKLAMKGKGKAYGKNS